MELSPESHLTIHTFYRNSQEKCLKILKLLESIESSFEDVLLGKEINIFKDDLPPKSNLKHFKKLLINPQEFENKINFNLYIEHDLTVEVWRTTEITKNQATSKVSFYDKSSKCKYCDSCNCDMCNNLRFFGLVRNFETSLDAQLYLTSKISFDMAYIVCSENRKTLFGKKKNKIGYFIGKKSFILIHMLFLIFRLNVKHKKILVNIISEYPEKKWLRFCEESQSTMLRKSEAVDLLKDCQRMEIYSNFYSQLNIRHNSLKGELNKLPYN